MTRKTFWIIFALAAACRLFAIHAAPLWYDENFTLVLARLPFDRMIAATAGDVHPPLWYLIEWIIFHAFPAAPVWTLRLPAAAFSLLALYGFDQLCDQIQLPARTRIIALCMMAFLPFQLWYAQEGRMYAMLECLVILALLFGLRRQWVAFTVVAVALPYTQNYGVIYLIVIAVVLFVEDRSQWQYIFLSGMTSALAFSPWAYVVKSQMTEIAGRYWIMDAGPGAVLNAIYKQFWASAMLEPGVITSHVLTFVVLILGTVYILRRADHLPARIILMMAWAPVALSWLISLTWQPILLFRPLIGISPFLYIIAASAFAEVSPENARRDLVYAACFFAPVFMFGFAGYYINIPAMKGEGAVSSMVQALTYIRANWQEGDVIYYADDGPMINIMPYAGDLPQYKLPACDERTGYAPVLGSLSEPTRAALGIHSADLADVTYTRAWVFAPRSPLHPQCYEDQIADLAPEGEQLITVDNNEFLSSGVWLVER